MARVRSMNRATHSVVLDPDKGDMRVVNVTGWHLDMDESVIWDLTSSPPDHRLRWWRCKPANFLARPVADFQGEWSGQIGEPFNWTPDNEDQMFVLLVNGQAFNANQGASDAALTNNGNACSMSWYVPGIGTVNVTVVAR